MNCEDVRESAAVALLMRTPVEPEVSAHLEACAECRDELAGFAPLPELLATLDAADLASAEPAGSALLDRLLAAAETERRRRRVGVLAAAAAAVLLVVVPLGIWGATELRGEPGQTVVQPTAPSAIDRTASDSTTGVTGRAQVWKTAWGSDLAVSISGVASGTRCTVVVVTKDGQTQTAATWQASYTGTAKVRGNVAAPIASIVRIDIVDDTGKVLLRI